MPLHATFDTDGARISIEVPTGTTTPDIIRQYPRANNIVFTTNINTDVVSANAWKAVREQRKGLLAASDWTQVADSPLTTEKKAEWATYRQALRDVTDQPDPNAIAWPSPPT